MTITTDASINFYGDQDTVTVAGGTASVSSGAVSVAADVVSGGWPNDDDAPAASMTFTGTFATAPNAGQTLSLYARLLNVDGTNDNPIPDANFLETRIGSFTVDTVTTSQTLTDQFDLLDAQAAQIYEFYLRNNTSDTLSAGWTLKITPKTEGPHP